MDGGDAPTSWLDALRAVRRHEQSLLALADALKADIGQLEVVLSKGSCDTGSGEDSGPRSCDPQDLAVPEGATESQSSPGILKQPPPQQQQQQTQHADVQLSLQQQALAQGLNRSQGEVVVRAPSLTSSLSRSRAADGEPGARSPSKASAPSARPSVAEAVPAFGLEAAPTKSLAISTDVSDDTKRPATITSMGSAMAGAGRRPSLGSCSFVSAVSQRSHLSEEPRSEDTDDDEEQIRILPAWERRSRRTKSTWRPGRRPSNASGMISEQDGPLSPKSPMTMLRSNTWYLQTEEEEAPGWLDKFVIRPSSYPRLAWDLLASGFILVDLLWVPLQAFAGPMPRPMQAAAICGTLVWTANIPISFLSGFNHGATVELRPAFTARNYLRSWFALDLLALIADSAVFCAIVGALPASVATGDIVAKFTLVRFVRALRLVFAGSSLSHLWELIRSERWVILLRLLQRVSLILILSHFVACTWFQLGRWSAESLEDSWVLRGNLDQKTASYQYATSLHWALTQFTPASMEVVPANTFERTFNITVVVVAMITFSSLVSAITNAMNRLQSLNAERQRQMSALRRYLGQRRCSVRLTARIWGCSANSLNQSKRRLHEQDVEVLALLPVALRADLYEEVHTPVLCHHPFFAQLNTSYNSSFRVLLCKAVAERAVPQSRELFTNAESGDGIFFVVSGTLVFTDSRPEVARTPRALPVDLEPNMWICEPALWIQWKHVGHATAETHCELLHMPTAKFSDALRRLEEPYLYVREYAAFFERNREMLSDIFQVVDVLQDIAQRAFRTLAEEPEADEPRSSASSRRRSGDFSNILPAGLPGSMGSAEVSLSVD